MNNTSSFYFLNKKIKRPSTCRSLSSTKVQQPSLEITATRIGFTRQKKQVSDMATSPMVFDSDIQLIQPKKKIVVIKNKEHKESPSLLVSDEIVKHYTKLRLPGNAKRRCPIALLAIPLPGAVNRLRKDRVASTSRHIRHLQREASSKRHIQHPLKIFDVNEIVSMSHANIQSVKLA